MDPGVRRRAIQRHLAAVQDDVRAVLDQTAQGKRNDAPHGQVLGEVRFIEVSVRGQMDGIRPIESVVLAYARDGGGWDFEGMQIRVQGLDGSRKTGTPLTREEFAVMERGAPGWAFDLVQQHRPKD